MDRLISKEMIPGSLWNNEESTMYLPPQLVSIWTMLLDKYGLREKAMQPAPEGFEGGISKEDTDSHLAWKFTGSSARVMLSIIDPHEELPEISDAFIRTFSGNKVFLADLPCGSGAASISILSVLCELRKQGRLPRMPLEVVIVGGEISKYAQNYAKEALESLMGELEEQAITIVFDVIGWDVCNQFSNTDLIRYLTLKSQHSATKLLMLANFSGFLQGRGKWKEAKKQFEELFRHSREENSIALWIEPRKNNVISQGGFMPRLVTWFRQFFREFLPTSGENDDNNIYAESIAQVKHPLCEGTFRNQIVVVRFDLPLKKNDETRITFD
jgi:hypothetical protein